MAKVNPFDRNVKEAFKPVFVNLEYIEDMAEDANDPLNNLLKLEAEHEYGTKEQVLEAWHDSCTFK